MSEPGVQKPDPQQLDIIRPDWPAPARVQAASSTRIGGVSGGVYQGLNLADHVADDNQLVMHNRELLRQALNLPGEPLWLNQVHSARAVAADEAGAADSDLRGDAAWSAQSGKICAVLTADCLPLLLCNLAGSRVASVHAGWRGLNAGVISAAIAAMSLPGEQLMAWLGPAIGQQAFEVGADVFVAFTTKHPGYAQAFQQTDAEHWLCDIYRLARVELEQAGVSRIYGGEWCTWSDSHRFYSYRRDGVTGRMASLIWLD